MPASASVFCAAADAISSSCSFFFSGGGGVSEPSTTVDDFLSGVVGLASKPTAVKHFASFSRCLGRRGQERECVFCLRQSVLDQILSHLKLNDLGQYGS